MRVYLHFVIFFKILKSFLPYSNAINAFLVIKSAFIIMRNDGLLVSTNCIYQTPLNYTPTFLTVVPKCFLVSDMIIVIKKVCV